MSDILNGDFPTPQSRAEEYLQAILTKQGTGSSGKDGATFIPSVSSEGVISWTNDGELDNPSPVNIKGPKGDTGATGPTGAKGDKGDTGAAGATGAQGPKGDKGDTGATGPAGAKGDTGAAGAQGPKGDTGASITAISLVKDSTGVITGGTATLSDNSTITITIEEAAE